MPKYPIFLDLSGRRVLIVGAGPVALRKARAVLDADARLVVVAENIDNMLQLQNLGKKIELIKSRYSKNYLGEAVLVIAATDDHELNRQIYKDCQQLEILCNIVDNPDLCDFYIPAVVRRGDLQITIGTEGCCPAYAGHLRKKLEDLFTENHGRFLNELESLRKGIFENFKTPADRKTLLGRLVDDESFEYFVENGPAAWRDRAAQIIKQYQS
jgi:precorrin-2 dehydrogenase/sirohydrochlorin ferrochelatase